MSDASFDEWVETITNKDWENAVKYILAHDPFPFFSAYQCGLRAAQKITPDEIQTIDDVAGMYKSEFGADSRYNDIKRIILKLKS